MKKFIITLALSLITIVSFAQVSPIKVKKPTWHLIECNLIVESNKCYLVVSSDNSYESQIVKIYLGNRYNTVIESLDNIIAGVKSSSGDNVYFIIQGYRFNIWYPNTAIITSNKLEYTAGIYKITVDKLEKIKKDMKRWVDGEYTEKPSDYNEIW